MKVFMGFFSVSFFFSEVSESGISFTSAPVSLAKADEQRSLVVRGFLNNSGHC